MAKKKFMKDQDYKFETGIHAGKSITRVPVKYLIYMRNRIRYDHSLRTLIKRELERRGTGRFDIDVSVHAIDQASLRLLKEWQQLRRREEGIYTWLGRMGEKARFKGTMRKEGVYCYKGIQFCFALDTGTPLLTTVTKNNRHNKDRRQDGRTPISTET